MGVMNETQVRPPALRYPRMLQERRLRISCTGELYSTIRTNRQLDDCSKF